MQFQGMYQPWVMTVQRSLMAGVGEPPLLVRLAQERILEDLRRNPAKPSVLANDPRVQLLRAVGLGPQTAVGGGIRLNRPE
jgi:hypothetical protein